MRDESKIENRKSSMRRTCGGCIEFVPDGADPPWGWCVRLMPRGREDYPRRAASTAACPHWKEASIG